MTSDTWSNIKDLTFEGPQYLDNASDKMILRNRKNVENCLECCVTKLKKYSKVYLKNKK